MFFFHACVQPEREIAAGALDYVDDVAAEASMRGMTVSTIGGDLKEPSALGELAAGSSHIVLLSELDRGDDEADMESILLLMNLRDMRERNGLDFNITVEMRREYNQKLVPADDRLIVVGES